jgi:hypothetical protein
MTLSLVQFQSNNGKIAPISGNFQRNPGGFLCTSDCLAERKGFELPVQVGTSYNIMSSQEVTRTQIKEHKHRSHFTSNLILLHNRYFPNGPRGPAPCYYFLGTERRCWIRLILSNGSLRNQSDPAWHKPLGLAARSSTSRYYAQQSPQNFANCHGVDEFPPSSIRFQRKPVLRSESRTWKQNYG